MSRDLRFVWAPGTSYSTPLVSYSPSDLERVKGQRQPNCSCWQCDSFLSVHPDWGTSLTEYLCCRPSVAGPDGAGGTGFGAVLHVTVGAVRVGRVVRGVAGAVRGMGVAVDAPCVGSVPCAESAPCAADAVDAADVANVPGAGCAVGHVGYGGCVGCVDCVDYVDRHVEGGAAYGGRRVLCVLALHELGRRVTGAPGHCWGAGGCLGVGC